MNTFKLSNFGAVFLRLLLMFLLGGLLLMAHPSKASACSCHWPGPFPLEFLGDSAVVFLGEVVSISPVERLVLIRDNSGKGNHTTFVTVDYDVEFDVETVWKGRVGETIHIMTAGHEISCGYRFSAGQYVVYSGDGLRTGLCSGTTELSEAEWILAELGEGRAPESATASPTKIPVLPTATLIPATTPVPPIGTPTPEASENETGGGCSQSPGSADLPIVGLMVGIAWFGLRKRRPDGR